MGSVVQIVPDPLFVVGVYANGVYGPATFVLDLSVYAAAESGQNETQLLDWKLMRKIVTAARHCSE